MSNYIVAFEYRFNDWKKVETDYKGFETLDEAKEHVARCVKLFKPDCDLFDVCIYERTNY